jgi:hypothetical protein
MAIALEAQLGSKLFQPIIRTCRHELSGIEANHPASEQRRSELPGGRQLNVFLESTKYNGKCSWHINCNFLETFCAENGMNP